MSGSQKRLATILALDVVGYSRASERDDEAAAQTVQDLNAKVEEIAAPFGGRVFSAAGDGFMLEFPSAAAGVSATMAVLKASSTGSLPKIRLGLHLGDVIPQANGDLLGHGVNVAARLQALAEPGTGMVSETVRAQVRASTGITLIPQGRVHLDKMDERIAVYSLSPNDPTCFGKIARRRTLASAVTALIVLAIGYIGWISWDKFRTDATPSEPQLAVLRFDSLGDTDPYFAAGMADELIAETSHIEGLNVTARASSFALTDTRATPANAARELGATMVLTGSVRRIEGRIRVQAQLAEAPSGRELWTDVFERPDAQAFDLQRDIAVRVAQAANARLDVPPHRHVNPRAYELYLQAREYEQQGEGDRLGIGARDLYRAAVEQDSQFAEAWAGLSYAEWYAAFDAYIVALPNARLSDNTYATALGEANRAITLDPTLAFPYETKEIIFADLGHWPQAVAMSAESRRRDPDAIDAAAFALGYDEDAYVAAVRRALRNDPLNAQAWEGLAFDCELVGDQACRLDAARRAFELAPTVPLYLGRYFLALAANGRRSEARALLEQHADLLPGLYDWWKPINRRFLDWVIGDGPPPSATEITSAVRQGRGKPYAAVFMLAQMHEWNAAASLIDEMGTDSANLTRLFIRDWAPLRRTPQFWNFMQRHQLLQYWRSTRRWPDFCAREHVCPA